VPEVKERARPCLMCRRPLLLSKEGFRCLNCRGVLCRTCAPIHFASKREQVMAMSVLKSMFTLIARPKLFVKAWEGVLKKACR